MIAINCFREVSSNWKQLENERENTNQLMFIIQFLFFFNQCHIHEHRKPLNFRKNSHFKVMAAMVILLKSANSIFGVQLKWILARRATFDETYRNFIRATPPNGITIIVIQQPELRSIESYRCYVFFFFGNSMLAWLAALRHNQQTNEQAIESLFHSSQPNVTESPNDKREQWWTHSRLVLCVEMDFVTKLSSHYDIHVCVTHFRCESKKPTKFCLE